MSKPITLFLKQNPIITRYTMTGLINISALAKHIKATTDIYKSENTISSISMDIRRSLKGIPLNDISKTDIENKDLKIVARSNMREAIFIKTTANRKICMKLFEKVSSTNHFSCLIEGEKEIVILTDYDLDLITKDRSIKSKIFALTDGLGYISVNFPLQLRKVVGVYSYITQALALSNISIHSFHTIGGEILILVQNSDLLRAQEILTSSLISR